MANKIQFERDGLIAGADKVANAVKITMGAKGRTVIMSRPYGGPLATKDGATVAKSIELKDPVENMGAQLIQEVSRNVAEIAGDGTTCATVLAQKMIKDGHKSIVAGMNPQDIVRGMESAVDIVLSEIDAHAKTMESSDEIAQVATISANGDSELGKQIADAVDKIGKDGAITVEDAKGTETKVEVVEGFQFDQGYLSPYFVSDADKMKFEHPAVRVFVSEKRITNLRALLPILEPIVQTGESLLIIADEIDSEALATLVLNRVKGGMKVCAVKAPGFGTRRKEIMGDIATLTGATLISDDLGMSFENITPDVLGRAKKVCVDKSHTLIVGGDGDQESIQLRIGEIRKALETSESEYDKEKLQERLGRMTGGVAVIRVGGMTEPEAKEKKDRVDDAVAATRAAIAEGIVPGGGVALLRASEKLDATVGTNADIATGIDIVRRALLAPISQIAQNAGIAGEIVIHKVKENSDYNYGYNVATDEYGNMLNMGVIDPAKVVKTALCVAASCAKTILFSGCVVSEIPRTDEPKQPGVQG